MVICDEYLQDGGCTCPGDVSKAFGAGADFVMIGGMFAGHNESGGDLVERNGKKLKLFYGMASSTAMKKYTQGVAEYRLVKIAAHIHVLLEFVNYMKFIVFAGLQRARQWKCHIAVQ